MVRRADMKMSEIVKEMARSVLRVPEFPSSEAAHAALLLAHVAWNRSLDLPVPEIKYRRVLDALEDAKADFWDELTGSDAEEMIEILVALKRQRYPLDDRMIQVCGMRDGNVHVEWYDGQDVRDAHRQADERILRAMKLVADGKLEEAVRHLCATTGLSRKDARRRVAKLRRALEDRMA